MNEETRNPLLVFPSDDGLWVTSIEPFAPMPFDALPQWVQDKVLILSTLAFGDTSTVIKGVGQRATFRVHLHGAPPVVSGFVLVAPEDE